MLNHLICIIKIFYIRLISFTLNSRTQTTIYFILIIYLLVKSSSFIYIMVIPLSHTMWLVPLPNINEGAKTVTAAAVVIMRVTRSGNSIDIAVAVVAAAV